MAQVIDHRGAGHRFKVMGLRAMGAEASLVPAGQPSGKRARDPADCQRDERESQDGNQHGYTDKKDHRRKLPLDPLYNGHVCMTWEGYAEGLGGLS